MGTWRTSGVCWLCVMLAQGTSVARAATFAGGDGTAGAPYQIASPGQLIALSADPNLWDKHFVLMRDLDMAGTDPNAMKPIGLFGQPFLGEFDGKGHTVANLRIYSKDEMHVGLFGWIGENAKDPLPQKRLVGHVRNLHLENVNVRSECDAGGLAGMLYAGTVENCSVSGTIKGKDVGGVGGLLGNASDGRVTHCTVNAQVYGQHNAGGLIGNMTGGEATCCSSSGRVENEGRAGGLIGAVQFWDYPVGVQDHEPKDVPRPGVVFRCRADGFVSGDWSVGGLIGNAFGPGKVEDCYATGFVDGRQAVGGLIGENWECSVIRCYATGRVAGEEETGGFIGNNLLPTGPEWARYPPCQVIVEKVTESAPSEGTDTPKPQWRVVYRPAILCCFWHTETAETTRGVGAGSDAQGGITRLTMAEMRTAAPFRKFGWDFESVWTIDEGKSYPRLRWEQDERRKATTPIRVDQRAPETGSE